MGLSLARLVVVVGGAAVSVLGLVLIVLPGGPGTVAGLLTFLGGAAMIVGALIERIRYRFDAVDGDSLPVGPGGGEPVGGALEPRFRPTDEVFVDPTTRERMRVWLDRGSGERRYVAESSRERP